MTSDRVAALLADIEAAPEALIRLLDAYGAPGGPLDTIADRPSRVVFTGLGSSRYAALTAAAQARLHGLPAWAELASTGSPTPPDDDLALVAISASGGTPEVVEAARRHRGRSRVIAVTNDPGSALAAEAEHVLPLLAGREDSGIATRTFRATMTVLALLVGRWSESGSTVEQFRPAVAGLEGLLAGRDAWLSPAADIIDGASLVDVIGDAADSALVHQAALMLREAPRLPAVAHDTADWLHTAVYLALPGHRALLFRRSAADAEVVATIRRRGGETVVIGPAIDGAAIAIGTDPIGDDPILRALVGSAVAELLAAALWGRASAAEAETAG
jgi:fructoselysine-6-P-deglycase FrlB-like protein